MTRIEAHLWDALYLLSDAEEGLGGFRGGLSARFPGRGTRERLREAGLLVLQALSLVREIGLEAPSVDVPAPRWWMSPERLERVEAARRQVRALRASLYAELRARGLREEAPDAAWFAEGEEGEGRRDRVRVSRGQAARVITAG